MEKQYILSERAHFMCPNMHFGIFAHILCEFHMEKVKESIDTLAQAHPFLRCVIQYEKDSAKLFYAVKENSMVQLHERKSAQTIWEDYEQIGRKEWNIFENGLLKLFLYPAKTGFQILFAAHHLLGDGRCLLDLVNEFSDCYGGGRGPVFVEERLIRGMDDLPVGSNLSGISKYLVKRLNRQWKKEGRSVTYEEYAEFAEAFVKNNPVSHESCLVESAELEEMKKLCREHEISINDLLMAKMYLAADVQKMIIAADVREQLSCYRAGAMGNYATAMGIISKTNKTNVMEKAKDVKRQVMIHRSDNRKLMLVLSCYLNMDAVLIDAAAIAALGGFESKAAQFVGGKMFGYKIRDGVSITNLGRIQNEYIDQAAFIPPASPAAMHTIGALTVNNQMQLCSSYYEKAISVEDVKRQLYALK